MATISAPFTFGQTQPELGYDYIFAEKEIQQSFKDRWDPVSMGVASLWGDLAGTGSDTLRVTYMDGVGLDVAMDALANENSPITNKSVVVGYSTLTTALYGIGYSDTYVQQAYSREPGMSLDMLKSKAPGNWVATMRGLACTVGSAFSAVTVGTTGSDLTIDDMIDLQTIFSEKVGSADRGTPIVTRPTAGHSTPRKCSRKRRVQEQYRRVRLGHRLRRCPRRRAAQLPGSRLRSGADGRRCPVRWRVPRVCHHAGRYRMGPREHYSNREREPGRHHLHATVWTHS